MALGAVPEDLRFFLKVSDVPVLKMLLDINCMDTFICMSAFLSTETYDDFDTRVLEVGMLN